MEGNTQLPFQAGDKAVYPGHGVAEITGLETTQVAGTQLTMYILRRILENGAKVKIPTVGNGLRGIMSPEDIKGVHVVLREKKIAVESTTWNRRYREYKDKIDSGDPRQIAEVLRDSCLLRSDKDLSFGERKMLDTAKSLLVTELSIAEDKDEEDVENDLEAFFEPAR